MLDLALNAPMCSVVQQNIYQCNESLLSLLVKRSIERITLSYGSLKDAQNNKNDFGNNMMQQEVQEMCFTDVRHIKTLCAKPLWVHFSVVPADRSAPVQIKPRYESLLL